MFNLSSTRAVKAFVFRGGKLRDFKSLWWVINVFLKILREANTPFPPSLDVYVYGPSFSNKSISYQRQNFTHRLSGD